MVDAGFGTQVTQEQLQSILTTTPPPAEAVAPKAGAGTTAARDDHVHARLTSVSNHAFPASGESVVTVNFTRSFTAPPGIACTMDEAAENQPVTFKVKTWVLDGEGRYSGAVIKGYRGQLLPALSGIALLGPLLTALANFNPFGGVAAGVKFSCIAIQTST